MENKKRVAVLGPTEEIRKMEIGEIVQFPFDRYNYNSIRSTPATLVTERVDGRKWKTRSNYDEGCTEVIRIA